MLEFSDFGRMFLKIGIPQKSEGSGHNYVDFRRIPSTYRLHSIVLKVIPRSGLKDLSKKVESAQYFRRETAEIWDGRTYSRNYYFEG